MPGKKNKNKNQQSSKINQASQSQVTKLVVKESELTTEDKERLIAEGETRKKELIAEGEKEKQRLIEEGKTEKDRLISQADLVSEKHAVEIISKVEAERDVKYNEYKKEAVSQVETIMQEKKILMDQELQKQRDNFANQKVDLDRQIEVVRKKDTELEKRARTLLDDSAKLIASKETYKSEIIKSVKKDLETIEKEKAILEAKCVELNNELKRKQKELSAVEQDKDAYEQDSIDNAVRRKELIILQEKALRLEGENTQINALLEEYRQELIIKKGLLESYGEDPNRAIRENRNLTKKIDELSAKLINYPSEEELNALREKAKLLDQKLQKIEEYKETINRLERQLNDATIYQDDLDNARRFIRVLELQKSELQKELDRIIETYNHSNVKVFPSLSKIDAQTIPVSHSPVKCSLKDLCENFRAYLALRKDNPLYYNQGQIRTFIAAFATTRLIILEGMSGTGKSSLPKAFAQYMDCVTARIPVQSSWKDRNDLLGFYNDFEKRYKETDFLKELYSATRDKDNIHCIMLDEMNLSRIEYYFADFLSVLEEDNPDKWKINLIADDIRGEMPTFITDGKLQVMNNTWFVGTANNDASIFNITDKVYDRAIVLDFKKREDKPKDIKSYPGIIHMSNNEFQSLLKRAITSYNNNTAVSDVVTFLDEGMQTYFDNSFGNRISNQIQLFVSAYEACGGTMIEAIDVIFATKVLRKVQGFYDESTKKRLNEFLDLIQNKYNKSTDFELSKAEIRRMISKI